jgi:hypothetical protein
MEGRQVSRGELFGSLYDSADEALSDTELDTTRQAINSQLGPTTAAITETVIETPSSPAHHESEGDGEVQFRLFASGPSQVAKVRVKSPDLTTQPPGLVTPHRPDAYHLQDELSDTDKEMIAAIAVSGEDVLARSQLPWPSYWLPWKVMAAIKQRGLVVADVVDGKKKKKPGKKKRIVQRQALAAAKSKEAALREKNTRRNREKKLKKKQKKKEKKAIVATPGMLSEAAPV